MVWTSNNRVIAIRDLLLLAVTVWSFAHNPLRLSDCNKMVLWPGCEGHGWCSLHKKNVRSVQSIVKRRGCCCNLSIGVLLNARFTTNGMCARNNTPIYVVQTSNIKVIMACDLFLLLLAATVWSFAHLPLRLSVRNSRLQKAPLTKYCLKQAL